MNHPDGKLLLAAVRNGDYAHAGEEEAIRLAWQRLPKSPAQLCLDAGCGRGGTAALVQAEGWGRVTGLDIDSATISAATATHPGVEFLAADVTKAGELFPGQFDVIYAFNAFYAFPDQPAALESLAATAKPAGKLCLFDYVDRGGLPHSPFGQIPETLNWKSLQLDGLPALLKANGWQLTECLEIHEEFRRWYGVLTRRLHDRRGELLQRFPEDLVNYASGYYQSLLNAIEDNVLGGAMVYAERHCSPPQ